MARHLDTISLRILAYLAAHPRAQDTVEGISRWWLPPPQPPRASVEEAILALERAGLVIRTSRPDGSQHFRGNPRERDAILAALGAAGMPGGEQGAEP